MKTVWVLTTDTDNGTSSSVYATKALGEDAYISTVNEFYRTDLDKRYGPDAKTFEEAQAKAQEAVDHGSMDFASLTQEEIEGYEEPKVVIYVEGGNVQGVSATEKMDVNLIDFDNFEAEGRSKKESSAILKETTKGMIGVL